MTKVAFWYDRPQAYSGGLNYIRNLLHAIQITGDKSVEPYVFFGTKVDSKVISHFDPLAKVVRTRLLDRRSFTWFVHKVLFRFFGSLLMVERELARHGIFIVSHAENVYGRRRRLRVIGWIPDFQYLHLPELFPGLNVEAETRRLQRIVSETDVVILSSHAALQDFRQIAAKGSEKKVRVLQFVSQPNIALAGDLHMVSADRIADKYNFKGKYFFLPNQFWLHKNHAVVFEAVRQLKAVGVDVLVLCTGNLRDYRLNDTSHADGLRAYIEAHHLQESIRILGLIDYEDVLFLMKNCLAVLNPSRFEGWSSTVEEAKSIGKQVVLSNIPVHIEQAPIGARYFSPDDAEGLASILKELWNAPGDGRSHQGEALAREHLKERTRAYGRDYAELIRQVESSID